MYFYELCESKMVNKVLFCVLLMFISPYIMLRTFYSGERLIFNFTPRTFQQRLFKGLGMSSDTHLGVHSVDLESRSPPDKN